MIAGSTKLLDSYKRQLPDVVYETLSKMVGFDFEAHPDGKYDINGYVMSVETGMTEAREIRKLEGHRRCIDLVYEIDVPCEQIGIVSSYLAGDPDEFYPDRDLYFYRYRDERKESRLLLSTGDFAVCFPEDLHRPLCADTRGPMKIRKAVLKIPIGDV